MIPIVLPFCYPFLISGICVLFMCTLLLLAMPRNYRIGVVKIEGPKEYYSWRFSVHVSRSTFKVKVPMNMYLCKIVEKVSFDFIDGKIWDKLETLVTKDGKTTVYPRRLCQLTKEEEGEEKERTRAF